MEISAEAKEYTAQQLYALCHNMNQAAFDMRISNVWSDNKFLTISIGMSVCQDGEKVVFQQLLSHSESALYAVKSGGRNWTMVYDRQMVNI